MRIVGGRFKGRALASVGKGDKAAHLRPTSDHVREAIFNVLVNGGYGGRVNGARVLDLFAGTGALGCEALSRGAAHCVFVDTGRAALKLIQRNIDLLGVSAQAKVIRQDATQFGPASWGPFDLVFLDPPYGKSLGQRALSALTQKGWLSEGAIIVWEEGAEQRPLDGFTLLDTRKYGETWVHILRVA